ncbi:MAG: right-handed parallel beta-helix repeat-containing protein [Candidatus Thorarchaeota archaeon]
MMNTKATLLFILSILIVSPLFVQPIGYYHKDNFEHEISWAVSYTDSSPILIEHDDNFTDLGFSGDGSQSTPYIIDNLNITSDLPCIEVRNTRAYFRITNCLIASETDEHSPGILFENVTNAYISSNSFSEKSTAVIWDFVNDSQCVDNEITGNENTGVLLYNCYNCELSQNNIEGNDDHLGTGIHIQYSYHCDVTNNEVANSFTGIRLSYSEYCTLDQNTLHDFDYGSQAAIEYPTAIHVARSPNSTISQNTISESPSSGISLDYTMGPQFVECRDNILSGCGIFPLGLIPGNFGFSTVGDLVNDKPLLYIWNQTGLNIDGFQYGQVILHEAKFCSITGGQLNEASVGVYLSYSTNCTIDDTESSGNQWAGAFMYYSVNCTFNNMVLTGNSRLQSAMAFPASVWVFGCQNSRVTNCEISDSEGAGLLIVTSPLTLVADNVFVRNGILVAGMGMPTAGDYYFIEKNNVLNGKQFGYFFNETDLTVDGTLYGQILVVNSSRINIIGGDFSDVTLGAAFVLSDNCSLESATVVQNSMFALQLISSTNTTVINCEIDDNPFSSIYNVYSESTDYLNNSICGNGYGIPENQYSPTMVVGPFDYMYNNRICHNRVGIQLGGQNITLYKNNISCNGLLGVYAVSSDYFNITENIISGAFFEDPGGLVIPDPTLSGIYISSGSFGVIRNNSVYSNSGYGIAIGSLSAQNISVYWNEVGWNGRGNAIDGGTNNLWDDDDATGNAWSDYMGSGTYPIPFSSSVDRYPSTLTDGTTPIVDSPSDEIFEAGTSGNVLVWHASDNYPGRFVVYQNGTVIANRTWCFEPIEVELDPLDIGAHNLTIVVYDGAGNHVSDIVIVQAIDTISPTIDSPDDVTYVAGNTGNTIVWYGSDLNPASYEIFIDDVSSETGPWTSSDKPITVNVDGLGVGTYNYTIVLTDQGGHSVSDTVMVVVTEPPTTPTTSTTTTTTSPIPDGVIPPMTIMLIFAGIGVVIVVVVVIRMKR